MTTFRTSSRRPASRSHTPASRSGAFTLVEMLVVIGIILLLSAILFPALKSVQERGSQTTCASNMQQLYLAIRLYKDDEREYPSSLAALLPDSEKLADTAPDPKDKGNNVEGTGYFRKTREELVCPDDDFQSSIPADGSQSAVRSSYADTSNDPTKAGSATDETVTDTKNSPWDDKGAHNKTYYAASDIRSWGRLSWNYWGYDNWGQAFRTEKEAVVYFTNVTAVQNAAVVSNVLRSPKMQQPNSADYTLPTDITYPVTPYYFNPRGRVTDTASTTTPPQVTEEPREANMFKYSLSNPQAPLGTIITHCVYHRILTAKNVISPGPNELYAKSDGLTPGDFNAPDSDGTGARDIVLRLDGTARSYDVSKWNLPDDVRTNHGSNWQNSDF